MPGSTGLGGSFDRVNSNSTPIGKPWFIEYKGNSTPSKETRWLQIHAEQSTITYSDSRYPLLWLLMNRGHHIAFIYGENPLYGYVTPASIETTLFTARVAPPAATTQWSGKWLCTSGRLLLPFQPHHEDITSTPEQHILEGNPAQRCDEAKYTPNILGVLNVTEGKLVTHGIFFPNRTP
jgi:hypothetical protein